MMEERSKEFEVVSVTTDEINAGALAHASSGYLVKRVTGIQQESSGNSMNHQLAFCVSVTCEHHHYWMHSLPR